METQLSLNQRSLKSLEPSPRKAIDRSRLFSKNRTATNSRPGELSDEPQLVIYYDNNAAEAFTRKNSAPNSKHFFAVHNSAHSLERPGIFEGLKKSPSLNIAKSSIVSTSILDSPGPTDRVLYHTKTFSLSEEIGTTKEPPQPSAPQHPGQQTPPAQGGCTVSPKRSFVSSLKLFQQTAAADGTLLSREEQKPKYPNPKNSLNHSDSIPKAPTASQYRKTNKLAYTGHLNIVNSNVYVQYQLGTPKYSSTQVSKQIPDSPHKQGPLSAQQGPLHKQISAFASGFKSYSSLNLKQPSKLLILPKAGGAEKFIPNYQPKKKQIVELNLAGELKSRLTSVSTKNDQIPAKVQSKASDAHATPKHTSPSATKAGSLATLKSMLARSITGSPKDYHLYHSTLATSNSTDTKQKAYFFSQLPSSTGLINIQDSTLSSAKQQPLVKKTVSSKSLVADSKYFGSNKSLDKLGVCLYHGLKQHAHLQELHQEIELLILGCNPVDDSSIPRKFYLPPKKRPDIGTLIIGLTDLLVREVAVEEAQQSASQLGLLVLGTSQSQPEKRIFQIRPGVQQAFSLLANHFELVVWSEEPADLTNQILDAIDPENRYITFRLYREECFEVNMLKRGSRIVKPHNIFANRHYHDVFQLCCQANYAYPYLDRMIPIVPFRMSTDGELDALTKWINMISSRQGNFLSQLLQFIERDFGFTTQCNKFLDRIKHSGGQPKN